MPAAEENQVLNALEDKIGKALLSNENAVFLARATCRGERELTYRVKAHKEADQWLTLLVAQSNPREWQYQIEPDADWSLAAAFLRLFDRVGKSARFPIDFNIKVLKTIRSNPFVYLIFKLSAHLLGCPR